MPIEIAGIPDSSGVSNTDQFVTRKGSGDVKATATQVSSYVLGNLSDQDVMDKLLNVDGDLSGLNANFLQGLTSAYLRNASNLNAGTVPNARLPQGTLDVYFTPQGSIHQDAGLLRCVLKLPNFIAGVNLMIQFGHSRFTTANTTLTVTFPEAFASGFTNENTPWVNLSPENRSDQWPSVPVPEQAIELRCQLYSTSLTNIRMATHRVRGSNSDYVRGNYIAIGTY